MGQRNRDYKRVYFFDLDTTEIKDIIDKNNVLIFDHHKSHEDDYSFAKTYIDVNQTSCSKHLYQILNSIQIERDKRYPK